MPPPWWGALSFQTQQSADEAQVILRGWSFNRKLLSKFELDFILVVDIYCFDHNRIIFGLCLNSWKSIFYLHLAKLITAVSFFLKPFIHNYLSHIKYKCLLTMTISFKIGKIVQVILIIGLFKWTNLSVTDRQWWFKHWYKNSWCELEKLIQWEDGRSWCKYRAYLVLHLFLSIFREQNIFWFYT